MIAITFHSNKKRQIQVSYHRSILITFLITYVSDTYSIF